MKKVAWTVRFFWSGLKPDSGSQGIALAEIISIIMMYRVVGNNFVKRLNTRITCCQVIVLYPEIGIFPGIEFQPCRSAENNEIICLSIEFISDQNIFRILKNFSPESKCKFGQEVKSWCDQSWDDHSTFDRIFLHACNPLKGKISLSDYIPFGPGVISYI